MGDTCSALTPASSLFCNFVKLTRLSAFVFLVVVLGCQSSKSWPQLKEIDPSLNILEQPSRLLMIASASSAPSDQQPEHLDEATIARRHEAVRALLLLQQRKFGVSVSSVKPNNTVSLDHVYVRTMQYSKSKVTLLATPSQFGDLKKPEGMYWALEQLTFNNSGKLLLCQAVSDKTVESLNR
jgi:hypothetical protein